LIDLGSGYFDFWHYIEPIFLTPDGISLFGNALPFDHVSEDIWSKLFVRLENQPDETIRIRRFMNSPPSGKRLESNILQNIPQVLKKFEAKTWRLLYRSTRDGFGATNFHAKCDQQSHTVTIIFTTTGYIFGGFTPIAWESGNISKADNTGKSFLVRLKNPRNTEPRLFPLSNQSSAIYCRSSYGPAFGTNCDLYIADNCDQNTNSHTILGGAYRNDTGLANNQVFTGGQTFQVKEIEVFTLNS
jgi:hypothetical protein